MERALSGRRNRFRRGHMKRMQDYDWRATIRENLKNYDPKRGVIVADRPRFTGRARRHLPWTIILCVDQSGSMLGSVIYAAAKGFVATATRGWAKELVRDRIRVNAVSPGVIMTPFHERYSTAEQLATMQATVPVGRLGLPEECVGAFLYLASDEAREVTGKRFKAQEFGR